MVSLCLLQNSIPDLQVDFSEGSKIGSNLTLHLRIESKSVQGQVVDRPHVVSVVIDLPVFSLDNN